MEKLLIEMPEEDGLPQIQLNGKNITQNVAAIIIKMKPGDCSILIHLQADPDNSNSPSAMLGAPFKGTINLELNDFPVR